MANSLNQGLRGKYVLISKRVLKPEYHDAAKRVFLVTGGFGASAHTMGRALFGQFVCDGRWDRYDGYDVERLATDEEIEAAKSHRL